MRGERVIYVAGHPFGIFLPDNAEALYPVI